MLFRLLASLAVAATPLLAQAGPRVDWSRTYRFRVTAGPGGWQLSGSVRQEQVPRNQAACLQHRFEIYQADDMGLENLAADRNGARLAYPQLSWFIPQSQDVFIHSGKVHVVDFPKDLRVGDRLAFSYDTSYRDLASFPLVEVPARDRVARLQVQVEHPAGLRVEFDLFQPQGDLRPVVDRPDPQHTRLTFQDLPAPARRPHDPFDGFQAVVRTRISRDGASLTRSTPEDLVRWYFGLQPESPADAGHFAGLLQEELERAPTPLEKTRVLFDYVKSEVHYVADMGQGHAYLPHPPREVLARRWGDCKDKAWLLATLARLHRLPVHMVWVSTRPQPALPGPHLWLYNHVICLLEDGGREVFMDPTDPDSELGDPPDSDLLGQGLVLDPARPRSLVVPNAKTGPDLDLEIQGDLAEPGRARATVVLRHTLRSRALAARRRLKAPAFEDYLGRLLNDRLHRIVLAGFKVTGSTREALTLEALADLDGFPVQGADRVYLPAAAFRPLAPDLPDRERDAAPIEAPGPLDWRLALTLKAGGWRPRPERMAQGEADGPSHTAACAGDPGTVRLEYRCRLPYRLVPEGARAGFLSFCRQYLATGQGFFTLDRSGP